MSNIYNYSPLWGSWIVGAAIRLNHFSKTHIASAMINGKIRYSHIKHIIIPLDNKNDISVEAVATRKIMLETLLDEVKVSDLLQDFSNINTYDAVKVVHSNNNSVYDIFLRSAPLKNLTEILCERSLTEIDVIKMAINICGSLEIAECKGVVHSHLSTDTIFIDEKDNFLLGDFCCSEKLAKFYDNSTKLKAMEYASPEEYKDNIITNSSNLYSLGIILYYLFNNCRLPFMPDNPENLKSKEYNNFIYKRIFSDSLPKPVNANDKINKIIQKCCKVNPNERWLGASDLKNALIDYFDELVEENDFKYKNINLTPITTSNLPSLNSDFESSFFENLNDNSVGKTIIETSTNNSTVKTISINGSKSHFKIVKTTKNIKDDKKEKSNPDIPEKTEKKHIYTKTYKPNRTVKPNIKLKTVSKTKDSIEVVVISDKNSNTKNDDNIVIHNPKADENTNISNNIDNSKEELLDLENYVKENQKNSETEKLKKLNAESMDNSDGKDDLKPQKNIKLLLILSVAGVILIVAILIYLLLFNSKNSSENNLNTSQKNESLISNNLHSNTAILSSINYDDSDKCATIPYLIGETPDNAKKLIDENNLANVNINVEIAHAYSSVVEKGYIISQSVPENTTFTYDATIQIVVSDGLSDDMIFAQAHQQKIEIISEGNSTAHLTLYQYDKNNWKQLFDCEAYLGKNGISEDYGKNKYTSPKGTFNILFAFGTEKPTTNLNFTTILENTVLITDETSPYYNTLQNRYLAVNLNYKDVYYMFKSNQLNYCIFFDFNGDGITKDSANANKGSNLTICGFNGKLSATDGCIDIKATDMLKLLSYLDSSKKPVVIIK